MVMRDGVVGIILQSGLQSIHRVLGFAVMQLNLTLEDQRLRVRWIDFQDLLIQLASFREAFLQDEQLNVILL